MTESAPRIQTEVQVMFFDTDCAAVAHNIAYLRFIEIARTLLAEQLGMKLAEMAELGKPNERVARLTALCRRREWRATRNGRKDF